ncbi:hypothetical protein QOT17_003430 [Balamuthia mandrillaris]
MASQDAAQPTQLALVQLQMDSYIQKLYDLLVQLRSKMCNESSLGLMPYMIFPSSELLEMATRMPTTLEQLQACGVISQKKIWTYGPRFVSVICEFVACNPPARLLRYQALTEPTD